jgi:hypothetical protein
VARLVAFAREAAHCEPSRKRKLDLVFASAGAVVAQRHAIVVPITVRPYFARLRIAAAVAVAVTSLALGAAVSLGIQRAEARAALPARSPSKFAGDPMPRGAPATRVDPTLSPP